MINIFIAGIIGASSCFFFYRILRSKLKICLNCWFCNSNQWVLYYQRNSFTCKKCDQYNGFNEYGDYNKYIPSQHIESLNINLSAKRMPAYQSTNGLCELCNHLQILFIERLNKFEAVDERRYFEEYERYKTSLNQKHPLCSRCKEYIEQKIQDINEKYLPRTTPVNCIPFPRRCESTRNAAIFVSSRTSCIISESASFSETIFSKPRKRSPSVSSRCSSRSASPFIRRPPPALSLFSEPINRTPPFINTSYVPSVASGATYKTAQSQYSLISPAQSQYSRISSNKSSQKLKYPNQRRYFSSGPITVACNILTLSISTILFLSLFDSSQISCDVRLVNFERYLPMDTVNVLHLCTKYGSIISAFASAVYYYGIAKSFTRLTFLDLLASLSWPIFSIFCIFDAQRNPDFNLVKLLFAAYLLINSSIILFIPKQKKRQRFTSLSSQNSFYSIPSNQTSNYSSASFPDLPDPVESWIYSTADQRQTVSEFHNLRI